MRARKAGTVLAGISCLVVFAGFAVRVVADCSSFGLPFTDLGTTSFCAQIAEAYYTGLSNGTSATAYSPTQNVPREQMAAFVTRTLDKSLSRGSRRSALQRFWTLTPHFDINLGVTAVGTTPESIAPDGTDVWVGADDGTVTRVRGSDGAVLDTWTTGAGVGDCAVLAVMGKVFVSADGTLYSIDPTHDHTTAPTQLAAAHMALALAFDGSKIWSAADEAGIDIFTPGASTPWSYVNFQGSSPDPSQPPSIPSGIVWDGANMWTPDRGDGTLKKLSTDGSTTVQNVDLGGLGTSTGGIVFDGTNLWVPTSKASVYSVYVVRASTGSVVRILTGNGLSGPGAIAFDGQRILVANSNSTVSLFQATSLEPIGSFPTGAALGFAAASDGLNFWLTLPLANQLVRY